MGRLAVISSVSAERFMEWMFQAADARLAQRARRAFFDFLQATCTLESDCRSAETVFGELVANVVRHAPGPIEIAVRSDADGRVTLDVCDSGSGFTLVSPSPASPYSERGRGLHIVAQLCARVTDDVGRCNI